MKKIIALIATLVTLFAFTLPAAAETLTVDEALLGTWVMDGIGAEFTFNADGTYDEVLDDMVGNGKYSIVDGKLYIDGTGPIDYVIDGDQMLFDDNGMEMSFTRKGSAVGGPIDAEALIGTWILTGTSLGITVDMKITFNEDGTYVMISSGQEMAGVYTIEDAGINLDEQGPSSAVLDGDTLTIEETGVSLTFTREGVEIERPGTADAEALLGTWLMESNDGFFITFDADGILTYSNSGVETKTVYTVSDDTITTGEGEALTFSIHNDRLTLEEAGISLTFIRK